MLLPRRARARLPAERRDSRRARDPPRPPAEARLHAVLILGLFAACSGKDAPGGDGAGDAGLDSCAALPDRPGACPGRGIYDSPVTVELAGPPGADLFYTLDGTAPSSAALPYDAPIRIEPSPRAGAVVLRAVSSQGGTLSRIATHTYVFPADVLTQPPDPDGRPATWGTGADAVPADYEMDPGVVGADAEAARTGLEAIPSISIVLEPEDLFGAADGIYMHPAESGDAWERAASAELLLPDVSPGFQIDCGIRIQGGSSTEDWKAAKLSLRLAFRSEYGPQRLVFPLFDGPVASFDSLVLDAHLNFTWVHPDHAQRIRAEYLRDAFTSDLLRAVGAISPHGRFVHLYLGGLYWGLYEVHERPDASFAASYQGGDSSDYDVLRHDGTELVEGTADAWNEMMRLARADLSDPAALDALGAYLDLGAFADYMLVNFWAGNEDWPHHNWYVARRRIPDAGFTFFSWDAEKTLQNVDVDVTGVDDPDGPGEIYQALLASADFRDRVTARAAELFGPGGAFEGDAAQRLYEARVAEIEDAILLESARWGDAERPGEPYTVDDWRAEVEWLRAEWFPARSAIAEGQLP